MNKKAEKKKKNQHAKYQETWIKLRITAQQKTLRSWLLLQTYPNTCVCVCVCTFTHDVSLSCLSLRNSCLNMHITQHSIHIWC